MKDEERHQFVNRVFDTFSWRDEPKEIWSRDHWDYDWYASGFDPIHPRAFDFEFFEAHPFKSQGDRLHLMTVEGYLYYMPSFISLLMDDVWRSNDLGDCLLSSLRNSHTPRPGSIASWVQYTREAPSPKGSGHTPEEWYAYDLVDRLENWFVRRVNSGQSEKIVNMTPQEREIVAQFLGELVKHPGHCDDAPQIQSVQSILRNESYGRRFGARTKDDIEQLLMLLDLAAYRYPASFPPQLADSIRRELERTEVD